MYRNDLVPCDSTFKVNFDSVRVVGVLLNGELIDVRGVDGTWSGLIAF